MTVIISQYPPITDSPLGLLPLDGLKECFENGILSKWSRLMTSTNTVGRSSSGLVKSWRRYHPLIDINQNVQVLNRVEVFKSRTSSYPR